MSQIIGDNSGAVYRQIKKGSDGYFYATTDGVNWEKIANEAGQDGRDGQDGAPGERGFPGVDGQDGVSSYLYVAYASDSSGSDFSFTPSDTLKYRAEIHTFEEIIPNASDFANAAWIKYIGDDGQDAGGASITIGAGLSGSGAADSPLKVDLSNYRTAASIGITIDDDMDNRYYRIQLGDAAENVGYPTLEFAQNRLGFYCDQKTQGLVYESSVLSLRNYGQGISGSSNRTRIELAKSAGISLYSYTDSLKFNGAELNTANGLLKLGSDGKIPSALYIAGVSDYNDLANKPDIPEVAEATTTVKGIVFTGDLATLTEGTDAAPRAFSAASIKAAVEEFAPSGSDIPEPRLVPDTSGFTKEDSGRAFAYNYERTLFEHENIAKYNDNLIIYHSFSQSESELGDMIVDGNDILPESGATPLKSLGGDKSNPLHGGCAYGYNGTFSSGICPGSETGTHSVIIHFWGARDSATGNSVPVLKLGGALGIVLSVHPTMGMFSGLTYIGENVIPSLAGTFNWGWNSCMIGFFRSGNKVLITLHSNGYLKGTYTLNASVSNALLPANSPATITGYGSTYYDEIAIWENVEYNQSELNALALALFNNKSGRFPDLSPAVAGPKFLSQKLLKNGVGRKFLNDTGGYSYPSRNTWRTRCQIATGKIVISHGLYIPAEEYAGLEVGVRLVKISMTLESSQYGYKTGDYASAIFVPRIYNPNGQVGLYTEGKNCIELNHMDGTLSIYVTDFCFQLGVNGTLATDVATVSSSYLSFFGDLSAAEQATWNFEFYIKF